MKQMRHGTGRVLLVVACFCMVPKLASAQLLSRPSQEVRTINTAAYAFNVQRNGRVDVEHTAYGVVFENAFPMVRFVDEENPEPLRLKGLASARTPVNDRLGEGQGFQFTGKDSVWLLRAYPTQPFFTVQVLYKNTKRKPVTVSALYPWAIGAPNSGALHLGPGADIAPILTHSSEVHPYPEIIRGTAESRMCLAIHNAPARRNLIAGFLTQDQSPGAIEVRHGADASATSFDFFRARCEFDPPREVAPGEQLASEVLYVSLAELDPIQGLRRYGAAVDAWNGDRDGAYAAALRAIPERAAEWTTGFDAPKWGALETLAAATRRFYLNDPQHNPEMQPVDLAGLTAAQGRAVLTGTALLGDEVRAAHPETLSASQQDDMSKLLPALEEPARPVDLFEGGPPQIWNLPLKAETGEWHIAGLFNWDPDKLTYLPLTLQELGLAPAQYYTVFDFWSEQYLGTAQGSLDVELAPGSVRLLGFRPFNGVPMVIATNQHITQGALSVTEQAWDPATGILHGALATAPDKTFTMWVLLPDGFAFGDAKVHGAPVTAAIEGTAVKIEINANGQANVNWSMSFVTP